MKLRNCLIAAALTFAAAAPAFAKDLPSGGLTREDVMKWLQGKGYTVEISAAKGAQN